MAKTNYSVYILTNPKKTVLYTGVTNDLVNRLIEHYLNRGNPKTFAGRYHCYYLLHFEDYDYINDAIKREKEIKGWTRIKKEALINTENNDWDFLNDKLLDWPPSEIVPNR